MSTVPHKESPKINRFITEHLIFGLKAVVVGILCGILLVGIYAQWLNLQQSQRESEQIALSRQHIQEEVTYWKGVAEQYHGYRDVYVKIATLEYSLGNVSSAQIYIEKALELDPNFEAARALAEKMKRG